MAELYNASYFRCGDADRGIRDRETNMRPIEFYTYQTPNGHKASIMLEETGLPYRVHIVDIERGDQHREGCAQSEWQDPGDRRSRSRAHGL